MSNSISRRKFLATSAATVASTASLRRSLAQRSANDTLGVALIGCGGQGRYVLRNVMNVGGDGVRLVAVCDIDSMHSDHTRGEMRQKHGDNATEYKDFRAVLDLKDVDVVVIGTPDYWHAPMMLPACQAGKDVYVEKPCAHTIHEGRLMVDAAGKYNRIVQVGQQQRSDPHFIEAMAYLHAGCPIGRITRTLTMNYGNETPNGMGMGGTTPPDRISEKDYDMWLGAAPRRPFNSNRWHVQWRWFFDYAAGMVGDWNVHIQDIVHWGMQVDAPKSVVAVGQKTLPDNRDTPDMIDILYEYEGPDGPFTQNYVMSKVYQRGKYPEGFGTEFFGADGSLFINRYYWEVTAEMSRARVSDPDNPGQQKDGWAPRTKPFKKGGYDDGKHHVENFLACVRSRKVADLHCDIEVGHGIATACHLGNIAWRLGRKLWWNRDKEIIVQQDGRPDREANQWLTKEYRKGYELPEV